MKFEALKDEYRALWDGMVIRSSFKNALDVSARRIFENKERYQAVSQMTGGVPWFLIGLIHQMESGCKFGCHLHNGDPLSARTVRVPARRPAVGAAPFSWEASACDALTMKSMQNIKDWSIERIAYELERYNGWGYRKYHKSVLSPYLWSGTTHYARGKYVSDGKWSAVAVSGQTGAMALLKRLMEIDETIKLGSMPEEVKPDPKPTEPDSFCKTSPTTTQKIARLLAGAGSLLVVDGTTTQMIPAPPLETVSNVAGWQSATETVIEFGQSRHVLLAICAIFVFGWIVPWAAKKWGQA